MIARLIAETAAPGMDSATHSSYLGAASEQTGSLLPDEADPSSLEIPLKLFTVYHDATDVSIVLLADDSDGAQAAGLLALQQVDPTNHEGLVATQLRVVEHPQGFTAVWRD